LSQPVVYPTPAAPNPLPPTSNFNVTTTSGCGGFPNCTNNAGAGVTLTPGSFGNISINATATVVLTPPVGGCGGTCVFNINSLTVAGNATFQIDPTMIDKVSLNIAGLDSAGAWLPTALQFAGNSTFNTANYDASKLVILYAGTGNITLVGGSKSVATVLAPNAVGKIAGGSDFYGAIIVNTLTTTGGATIHYDKNLNRTSQTAGARMMSSFSWKSF
jgi:hypothetical protein